MIHLPVSNIQYDIRYYYLNIRYRTRNLTSNTFKLDICKKRTIMNLEFEDSKIYLMLGVIFALAILPYNIFAQDYSRTFSVKFITEECKPG
jgi:hypothetical protein